MTESPTPIVQVEDLRIAFQSEAGTVDAVRGVSFAIAKGEKLALVGESGSGKSVTALALTRLLPEPPAKYLGGRIRVGGRDVLAMDRAELRAIRGGKIAYVFQEPSTSLNPVFTLRSQLGEAIRLHRPEVSDIDAEIVRWLDRVGIPDPAGRLRSYPHELSGGMQQRAMIAMALSCNPDLLVADEPTTALDVTTQAQILEQMQRLRREIGMAVLLITHNFGIVKGVRRPRGGDVPRPDRRAG
jgi:ABC-type dipeptide/oligopeptide/nickel transport system ATPase component